MHLDFRSLQSEAIQQQYKEHSEIKRLFKYLPIRNTMDIQRLKPHKRFVQANRGQVTKKSFRSANNGLRAEDQTNSGLNKLLDDVIVPQVDIPTRWGGRHRRWPQMLLGEESPRRNRPRGNADDKSAPKPDFDLLKKCFKFWFCPLPLSLTPLICGLEGFSLFSVSVCEVRTVFSHNVDSILGKCIVSGSMGAVLSCRCL